MKVLALGGCGQEGSNAVRFLAERPEITRVVVGDIATERARALAAEFPGGKVEAVTVDVCDAHTLQAAVSQADVVLNFVGPYYRFGSAVIDASLHTGVPYVDINDDYDATEAMLELDGRAREAGVTALVGMGASPGLTNVMARHAADQLDRVEEIHIRWGVSITDVEEAALAAIYHALHIVDGEVPQFLDGKMVRVPALSGVEETDLPGLGRVQTSYMGHPEPVTLPRAIPGVQTVTNKGTIPGLDPVLHGMRQLGLTRNTPLPGLDPSITCRDVAVALLAQLDEPSVEEIPPVSAVAVTVSGVRDGAQVMIELASKPPLRMGPVTGAGAAVGALLVGQGKVSGAGVLTPEACLDAAQCLAEFHKMGVYLTQRETQLRDL